MESPSNPAGKNTNAYFAQAALAFGLALDQARIDRILAEHDPWKEVA